ncbi:MAG: hypothetical protein IVW57_11225 [Ktedonobacterales bacterium]|nr:hypothetical protein [Ktedonobacterales bacterium]
MLVAVGVSATERVPSADLLEARARQRLASELERLPPWGVPAWWARLRAREETEALSLGTLAHLLAAAHQREDAAVMRDLFTLMLERTEWLNQRWAVGVAARTPGLEGAAGYAVREDLRQELTLYLWRRLALCPSEPWQLFFHRALEYAQRHVAAAYMERNAYWVRGSVRAPRRVLPRLLSRLVEAGQGEMGERIATPAAPDAFSAAELADLRLHVERLPSRERAVVVMRFWQQADEREIAAALGVTTRTVRNILRRAYQRLRTAYTGEETSL